MSLYQNIEIISAPSILGLKPSGVEYLPDSLLSSGIAEFLQVKNPVISLDTLNHKYSYDRDSDTKCLNTKAIRDFSSRLITVVHDIVTRNHFPLVLGGDCSILIGIMPALKTIGKYGLVFMDAHADFYEPENH
jgi:arginase